MYTHNRNIHFTYYHTSYWLKYLFWSLGLVSLSCRWINVLYPVVMPSGLNICIHYNIQSLHVDSYRHASFSNTQVQLIIFTSPTPKQIWKPVDLEENTMYVTSSTTTIATEKRTNVTICFSIVSQHYELKRCSKPWNNIIMRHVILKTHRVRWCKAMIWKSLKWFDQQHTYPLILLLCHYENSSNESLVVIEWVELWRGDVKGSLLRIGIAQVVISG